jgi:hypothetical protein
MNRNDHDHRGEYAEDRHDHDLDYAEKHHRHYDLEAGDKTAQQAITCLRGEAGDLRRQLNDALERITALEKQTPQARQLQYEADLAAADLAESGYDPGGYGPPVGAGRHGRGCQCPYCYDEPEEEPSAVGYDPGPEIDDEGGMSEYRYVLPGDYQRGQS